MLEQLVKIAFGIIGLSIIVMVHEAGHFAAARLSGIRVETFSIGFGKRLIGFRRGETDYRISLIPLGGYCRFVGEQSFRRALDEKLDSISVTPGEFYGTSPIKRIFISLAGPLANLVFASIVFFLITWIGYQEYYTAPKIVLASDLADDERVFPADIAGLKSGDIIFAADGKTIDRYNELRRNLVFRPGETIELSVDRDGQILELQIVPEMNKEMGAAIIGVLNWIDPVIGDIDPGSPAALAGFRSGDRIRSVDGIPVAHTAALNQILGNIPDSQVILVVENGGESREIILKRTDTGEFTVVFRREPGPSSRTDVFKVESGRSANFGVFGSFSRGIQETYLAWTSTWKGLVMLFRGADIGTSVSGPFRLISETGSVVVKGFSHGFGPGMLWSFEIMALISVSLALLNLLPIPVLDGGQTLLFLTEIIRGKPTNPRSVYRYQIVGTIIVLIIFIGATMNDFMHLRNR